MIDITLTSGRDECVDVNCHCRDSECPKVQVLDSRGIPFITVEVEDRYHHLPSTVRSKSVTLFLEPEQAEKLGQELLWAAEQARKPKGEQECSITPPSTSST